VTVCVTITPLCVITWTFITGVGDCEDLGDVLSDELVVAAACADDWTY
jgi:hypothetical protein